MTNGRFQILLRRRQIQAPYPTPDDPVVDVIVHCAPLTGWAEYIPGTVDNITPFEDVTPVGGWYDFSGMSKEGHQYIEPDFKLSFTWDKINSGDSSNSETSQDGSNYDKGISSEFTFFDAAYRFIYDWLLLTECSLLNAVEVKIIDLIARGLNGVDPAGNYRIFEIKSDNIEYAPVDEPCQFHIKLREQDNVWHCIHKTFIWDNWQHWFEDSTVKEHPTFLTCIEPRPRLINSARMALLLFFYSNPSILFFLGKKNVTDEARNILNANRFVDAPLARTYIENIAGKCNLAMDTIFDAGQEWENLCIYFPQAGFMYENNDDAVSPSQAFSFDNRWLITIAELLDKLKTVFAAEWYVTPNNTIVFKHTKDLLNLLPIYDFTLPDAEPIYNLRYSFNGTKKPAYGRYEYTDDGSDLASQEMSTLYSDIIDYDGPANNPMLEGERVKNFQFAPTGFVRDGRSKDYLELLINDGKIGALILLGIVFIVLAALGVGVATALAAIALAAVFAAWLAAIFINSAKLKETFVTDLTFTGAVRLTSEQTLQPRLLLWDGINMQAAKVEARVGLPIPNPYYNPNLTPYNEKNKIQEDNPSAIVYNYPMYFDGDFFGNLFDKYHDQIDNPLKSLETHQDVKWSVDLCEGMLNLFGVFQNQYAQIGKIVKLETRENYDVYVRIGNISVDYDDNKVNLRGIVIRRKTESVDNENPGNIPVVTPEESPGGPPPDAVCLKWINNGTEDSTVTYRDCDNILIVDAVISPTETFCSIEIVSIVGGNIQATEVCIEESGESGSPSGSPSGGCIRWVNMGTNDATGVSYIDCDGTLVGGATIGFMDSFCAMEIISMGTCGTLINAGTCGDCAPESGEDCCTPTDVTGGAEVNPPGLRLLFDDISNAPVGDPSSVSDWNTFFDMGVEASSPFTDVVVNGNEVILIGAIGMNMKDDSFSTNNNIISVIDEVDCVTSVGANVFLLSSSIQTILLPVVTTVGNSAFQSTTLAEIDLQSLQIAGNESFHDAIWISIFDLPLLTDAGESCFMGCNATEFLLPQMVNAGFSCFSQCLNVTDFYFPSCTNLGGTTGDDLVFLNTIGTTVTLTIPTATATDDDVVYLQANNTVTLVLV